MILGDLIKELNIPASDLALLEERTARLVELQLLGQPTAHVEATIHQILSAAAIHASQEVKDRAITATREVLRVVVGALA